MPSASAAVQSPSLANKPAALSAIPNPMAHYNALVGQIGRMSFNPTTLLPQLGRVLSAAVNQVSSDADLVAGKMPPAELQKQLRQLLTQVTRQSNYSNLTSADRHAVSQVAAALKELVSSAEAGSSVSIASLQKALMAKAAPIKGGDAKDAQQINAALADFGGLLNKLVEGVTSQGAGASSRVQGDADAMAKPEAPATPAAAPGPQPRPDAPSTPPIAARFTNSIQKIFHYVYEAVDSNFKQPQSVVPSILAQLQVLRSGLPSEAMIDNDAGLLPSEKTLALANLNNAQSHLQAIESYLNTAFKGKSDSDCVSAAADVFSKFDNDLSSFINEDAQFVAVLDPSDPIYGQYCDAAKALKEVMLSPDVKDAITAVTDRGTSSGWRVAFFVLLTVLIAAIVVFLIVCIIAQLFGATPFGISSPGTLLGQAFNGYAALVKSDDYQKMMAQSRLDSFNVITTNFATVGAAGLNGASSSHGASGNASGSGSSTSSGTGSSGGGTGTPVSH